MTRNHLPGSTVIFLFGLGACSGGGTSPTSGPGNTGGGVGVGSGFEVADISVAPGELLPLNGLVDVRFTGDVDFSTVSSSTLSIVGLGTASAVPVGSPGANASGAPAVGDFFLIASDTVRFRPACPNAQGTGTGFAPGTQYTVRVVGTDVGGPTVQSTAGNAVGTSRRVTFLTPRGQDPSTLFDTPPGPPSAIVRAVGSMDEQATHLEIGLDPNARVYFEADPVSGQVMLPSGFLAPINTYSRSEDRVAWIVHLDQAIDPSPANLEPARVGLEYFDSNGQWVKLATDVSIETNCSATGASLRLTPMGILAQGSNVRAYLAPGFADLSGDALAVAMVDFADAQVATSFDPGTTTPGDDGDELLESFLVGGPDSLEDTSPIDLPRASWGNGRLTSNTNFSGTGGPGGDFDWSVPPGIDFVLDTTVSTIFGGPGGAPTTQQTVINGVVDLRNLFVPAGARIVVQGPNPLLILASGSVQIDGEIVANGGNSAGVGTLNTTNLPETGASGHAGGGQGGAGSFLVNQSTPRGGSGQGAFNAPQGGGQGGESSYHPSLKNARRGAGGGGGRFGHDVFYDWMGSPVRVQELIGLDAEPGFLGGEGGLGAISQNQEAMGGAVGPSPFVDANQRNDFFGTLRRANGTLVQGELSAPWAGAGGGGGGDAIRSDTFPLIPFATTGDEKGAGGGGGAGSIRILALREIVVGPAGAIRADGGHGGGGENTNFFDRVGGGSGGGAGGHIVLESATRVEIEAVAVNAGDSYHDMASGHRPRPLSALGGQGGAGHENRGGANENGPVFWRCDSIPPEAFAGLMNPPFGDNCFVNQIDVDPATGIPISRGAGGDGSPGVIQIHVPNPSTDLVLSGINDGDFTKVFAPPPVGWNDGVLQDALLPSIGSRSAAQSDWIALGAARHDPSGPDDQVMAFFEGLAAGGMVPQASGSQTVSLSALVGPAPVASAPQTPYIDTDPFAMVFDASGISGFDDVYERNPSLLRQFTLRLSAGGSVQDFNIASASYDPSLDEFRVLVDAAQGRLTSFSPGGAVEAQLITRSFLMESGGVSDAYPDDTAIFIAFDATKADALGRPDPAQSLSASQGGFASDPAALNMDDWDFLRFRVELELDANSSGLDPFAPSLALRHLRVPTRF